MLCSTQLLDDTDQLEDVEPVQVVYIVIEDQGTVYSKYYQDSDYNPSFIHKIDLFSPFPPMFFLWS